MKSLHDVTATMPGLAAAMSMGCDWLIDVAQMRTEQLTTEGNQLNLAHTNWRGSFRGEYEVATKRWNFFCPIWHGGQAIKGLSQAYLLAGDERYLRAAHDASAFVLNNQIDSATDDGLILAYENIGDQVYTSAVLESLDGLFVLGKVSHQRRYVDAALRAVRWCREKAWLRGQGLMRDLYDPKTQRFIDYAVVAKDNAPGRPLADDAIWLKAYRLTGDEEYRDVFYDVLHRLLRDERPAGNWVDYGPCLPATGECHPRHAYWWGMPMIDAWQDTRDEKWLDAARRSGEWYTKAQRNDGGLFRFTDANFKTDSFGHATSGIMCAAIMWIRLYNETRETRWLEPIRKAMTYAMQMQFTHPSDPNLKGCILEKVLPPDGTDRNPYYIRDLGTIFFVQAAAQLLLACTERAEPAGVKVVVKEVATAPRRTGRIPTGT